MAECTRGHKVELGSSIPDDCPHCFWLYLDLREVAERRGETVYPLAPWALKTIEFYERHADMER